MCFCFFGFLPKTQVKTMKILALVGYTHCWYCIPCRIYKNRSIAISPTEYTEVNVPATIIPNFNINMITLCWYFVWFYLIEVHKCYDPDFLLGIIGQKRPQLLLLNQSLRHFLKTDISNVVAILKKFFLSCLIWNKFVLPFFNIKPLEITTRKFKSMIIPPMVGISISYSVSWALTEASLSSRDRFDFNNTLIFVEVSDKEVLIW